MGKCSFCQAPCLPVPGEGSNVRFPFMEMRHGTLQINDGSRKVRSVIRIRFCPMCGRKIESSDTTIGKRFTQVLIDEFQKEAAHDR